MEYSGRFDRSQQDDDARRLFFQCKIQFERSSRKTMALSQFVALDSLSQLGSRNEGPKKNGNLL